MTGRERTVMQLCSEGLSQSEIAAQMGLSNQTIARTCKALGIKPADGREPDAWDGVDAASRKLLRRIARFYPERVAA